MAVGAARTRAQRMARGLVMERSWPGWSECAWRGSSVTIESASARTAVRERRPAAFESGPPAMAALTSFTPSSLAHSAGTGDDAKLAAGAIDQQRRRHAEGLAGGLEILKHFRARIGVIAEPRDADVLQPRLRLVGIAGVDVDGDDLEVRRRRACPAVRRAPASPCGRARTRWPTGSTARCGRASRARVAAGRRASGEGEIGQRAAARARRDRPRLRRAPAARAAVPVATAGAAGRIGRIALQTRQSRIPPPARPATPHSAARQRCTAAAAYAAAGGSCSGHQIVGRSFIGEHGS